MFPHSATASSSATSVSTRAGRGDASRASARRSKSSRSLMSVPYLCAQRLKRAELKLLDGALRAPESAGRLADAFLFCETHRHDAPLVFRKVVDEREEPRPVHRLREVDLFGWRRGGEGSAFAGRPLPMVRESVTRDPEKPTGEPRASPFPMWKDSEYLSTTVDSEVSRYEPVRAPWRVR